MNKVIILFLLAVALSASAQAEQQRKDEQPQIKELPGSPDSKPDAAQARLDAGRKLWAEKKLDLAEVEYRKAVEENPESVAAQTSLAGFLLLQNKTKEAIPVYQDAITLDPQNAKLFAGLSIAYLHQSKYSMASAMADEALRLDPEMKQAEKLNEYIDAKLEAIERASNIPAGELDKMPDDAMHKIPEHGVRNNSVGDTSALNNASPAPSPH